MCELFFTIPKISFTIPSQKKFPPIPKIFFITPTFKKIFCHPTIAFLMPYFSKNCCPLPNIWHHTLKHYLSFTAEGLFYLNTFSEFLPAQPFEHFSLQKIATIHPNNFCHPTFKNILLHYPEDISVYFTCQKFLPFHPKNYFVTLNFFCHPSKNIFSSIPKIIVTLPPNICFTTLSLKQFCHPI